MSELALHMLGPPRIELGSEPIKTSRRKVIALLAYLAVTGTHHSRDALATLLWPERSQSRARAYLRRALSELNRALGEGILAIDRETAGLYPGTDVWLDVDEFRGRLAGCDAHDHPLDETCSDCVPLLTEAVDLYRGDFLAGFTLRDSPAFDEWQFFQTQELRDELASMLERLARWYAQQRDHEVAIHHVRRWLALDPLNERAHRDLMDLYVKAGHHAAALRQYQECARILEAELGASPSPETRALYARVRTERATPTELPAFLLEEEAPTVTKRPVFVARERELARLDGYLREVLAGRGQIVFVTGGPGRGKTALMSEFARRAMDVYPELLVATGNCNAFSGVGDPYLPFRAFLDQLTGDVAARWAAGTITQEHALRLWHSLSLTAQALVDFGPDLVDTFVPGAALAERSAIYAATASTGKLVWVPRLRALVERQTALQPDPFLQQSALFKQYARVLGRVADQSPLLLVLDDLQWIDSGSLGLLFHMSREIAHSGCRVLILGAYRPEEVAPGRERHPHRLNDLLVELKRRFGDVWLDLAQVGEKAGRRFLDALLDSEPNRFDAAFRDAMYRYTAGHPLFATEVLRSMQDRGDLVQDTGGAWVAGPTLSWDTLPPKVEGVIEERINRLDDRARDILTVASVEGEEFTAQVIARVREADDWETIRHLSDALEREHRLVKAQEVRLLGGSRLSVHRFRHNLFQSYLYNNLNEAERAYLHQGVGNALEALYADQPEALVASAPQLARHFQNAGALEKAVGYLGQAGQRAVRFSASEEAVTHFTSALDLLERLPDTPGRTQAELGLQVALASSLQATRGWASPEVDHALVRARELCRQVGQTPQLFDTLRFLNYFHGMRAEYHTAIELGEQMLRQAQCGEEPMSMALAHLALGWVLLPLGKFSEARTHLEHMLLLVDPERRSDVPGLDPRVAALTWLAWSLWLLGYPDQALQRGRESVILARQLDHPFTLVHALGIGGAMVHAFRREAQAAQPHIEEEIRLSNEHGFAFYLPAADTHQGFSQIWGGQADLGIVHLRRGLAGWEAQGSKAYRESSFVQLADAHQKVGATEEGLDALAVAEDAMHETGEHWFDAELYRVKGELALMQGDEVKAEAHLHKAIEIARQQSARSLELRATMSLCRLWKQQGRSAAARQLLTEIYDWFTEGFETLDLKEAKALLDELSGD